MRCVAFNSKCVLLYKSPPSLQLFTMSVLAADDEQSAFLAKQKARLDSLSLKANTRSSELEANSSAAESSSTFLSAFNGTYQETITILAALPSKTITASERASTLATLTTATHTAFNLRALTASASLYLNAYDVRQCELKVDTLLKQIEGIKKTAGKSDAILGHSIQSSNPLLSSPIPSPQCRGKSSRSRRDAAR